jgi:DNA polymerase-3 subunit delta
MPKAPSILDILKKIKRGKLQPLYYLFGEDSYNLDITLAAIEEAAKPFILSEFDKETYYGEDKDLLDVLNAASTFPFGSEKKLIIFKEFEKVRDKKGLTSYSKSPQDFTILVVIHNGSITNLEAEPFKTLQENEFIFEAKELKGKNLLEWLISLAESKGKILTEENAQLILDISGENRHILEIQIEKIFTFLGEEKEITYNIITSLSSALKEYNIFDLQNAIAKRNKAGSLKIAISMIDKGAEPTFIIYMLTRYFTGLLRINELKEQNLPEQAAARIVGTHPYYYKDYLKARTLYSDEKIFNAAQALLKADLSVKTTSINEKTVISLLIAEILQ